MGKSDELYTNVPQGNIDAYRNKWFEHLTRMDVSHVSNYYIMNYATKYFYYEVTMFMMVSIDI